MVISSVKKTVLLALLGIISATLVLGFVYRDTLATFIVSTVSEVDENRIEKFVGQHAPENFMVTQPDGDGVIPITHLLDEEAILVTYRESCSACRTAVNQYLALRGGRDDYGNTVYLLADHESNVPNGFPASQFLRVQDAPNEHMFEGRASPRIYRFDEGGALADFMIGHHDLDFQRWMTQIYGG
ncbi:MAG: hypothetical protein WD397_12385 [Wenzhouxiangellaceae bacterium]